MDPKPQVQKERPSASEQQLKQTIKNLAQNFESDAFLAFTKSISINFIGRIIVNYKGLGVIKFRKSQFQAGEFNEAAFKNLCQQKMNNREDLFEELQKKYPTSSVCIIEGGLHKSTGQLASHTKGSATAYIY